MKFYLASRYSRREELKRYALELEAAGHQVTARWLSGSHDGLPDGTNDVRARGGWAAEDVEDIRAADALIAFTVPVEQYRRGGMHVEVGIALALDKQLYAVGGHRPNVFYCLPQIEVYETWPQLMASLLGAVAA